MNKYKVEINGIDTSSLKVLNAHEMNELFIKYRDGDLKSKDLLVEGNLKLVLSIIKNYNNTKCDINDLFQVGCVGLVKAIDNFNPEIGVMFSTYAVPLILGEVKRYVRDSSSLRISRSIRDLSYHIMKYKDKYMSIYGVEPKTEEILKELNITEYELKEAMESNVEPASIYEAIYNDGGDTIYLLDQLKDTSFNMDLEEDLISLREALLQIKEKEKEILISRYIIGKTQTELAYEWGVSQAQISRIEKSALDNVRKLIR